jgi:hypothetical protein
MPSLRVALRRIFPGCGLFGSSYNDSRADNSSQPSRLTDKFKSISTNKSVSYSVNNTYSVNNSTGGHGDNASDQMELVYMDGDQKPPHAR